MIIKGCSLRTRSYMGQSQQLEIRKDNLSNTVTTVPKDFLLALTDNSFTGEELKSYVCDFPLNTLKKKGFKLVSRSGDGKFTAVKPDAEISDTHEYMFIREMSPLEAFRFMGYTDEDFNKARKALNDTYYKGKDKSNTRLYRLAGNSIVVDVCEALFKQLFNK